MPYKPKEYLFEGQNSRQYSRTGAQKVFQRACTKAVIKKRITLHTSRPSFATDLLVNGIYIRCIQELLEQSSPKTTMMSTPVSQSRIQKIKNPSNNL